MSRTRVRAHSIARRGPSKAAKKPIACSVDLLPVELPEPAADASVMLLEQREPRRVPDLGRTLGGADDVGKQHRRQNPIRLPRPSDARQEPLRLAHRPLMHFVIDPGEAALQAW